MRTILVVLVIVIGIFVYMYQKDAAEQKEIEQMLEDDLADNENTDEFESIRTFVDGMRTLEIEQAAFDDLEDELHKKVIGMREFLHSLFVTLLVGGHALVEGVPGLAKTRTISAIAQALDLRFKRIQFTPDMLPGDITGVEIYNSKTKQFDITEGPIFANIVLADEINRTTPKVQSALLEAMQEKQVTIGGKTMTLPQPFFVLATQNPLEQEGTYPLPEAQVDRFLFHILVDYPTEQEEQEILQIHEDQDKEKIKKVMSAKKLADLQEKVAALSLSENLKSYIVRLVAATREVPKKIEYGASPRASIALMHAARAVAFLAGKERVTKKDVQTVCLPVLRHRVILPYELEARGQQIDDVLVSVLRKVPYKK